MSKTKGPAAIKPLRVWVAIDSGGMMGPWTVARTRKECKRALIEDWLGEDCYARFGHLYKIVRATLTPEKPT